MAPGTTGGRSVSASTPSGTRTRLHAVLPGTTLGTRYRVERLLASGAMGEVWQAVHGELRMRVALKTLRREIIADHEIVARFSREAHLLSRVQSEHLVRVHDFFVDRRVGPVLVTEYVDGVPLSAMLASRRFTVEEAIELAIDLVTGLRELHRAHIVHRDVKPSNILMRRTGGECSRPVFIDLGVSRLLREGELSDDDALTEITTADRAVGTFEYMPPEQILNSRNVTESADLYAVGAILFRAVAGENVFGSLHGVELLQRKLASPAPPLETGRSDRVAMGFQELVRRALAMAPDNRYELAEEMLADLSLLRDAARRATQVSRAASTIPPRATPAVPGARGRRATVAACVVVALLVGAGAGAFGANRVRRPAVAPAAAAATLTVAPTRGAPVVCESPADEAP
ncbi:MAG TPA: serine/threonine-protein kinase [Polyangiaceae bacterium]